MLGRPFDFENMPFVPYVPVGTNWTAPQSPYIQQQYQTAPPFGTAPDVPILQQYLNTIRQAFSLPPSNPMNNNNLDTVLTTVTQNGGNTANCACLVGTPFTRADGSCGCTSPHIDTPEPTPPIKTTTPVYTSPPIVTTTTPPQINVIETLKANPMIALGGAAVIAYLLLKK